MAESIVEFRVEFTAESEWLQWKAENRSHFEPWRDNVISWVRENGLIEPTSRQFVKPASIRVIPNNYRESLSAGELNCRKRALLLEVDTLRNITPYPTAAPKRAYVIGRRSRIASLVAELYPHQEQEDGDAWWETLCDPTSGQASPADASYDLVCASDALELVPDLPTALREIARVMALGGTLMSGAPVDDTLAYSEVLQPPGAPFRRPALSGPALQRLGWDILDKCRDAGFTDAKLVLHISAICGITADKVPGVFVLSATKGPCEPSTLPRKWLWPAKRIRHVVGLIGLPRSGTTMLTAVLDAHTAVTSIYEPWNVKRRAVVEGKFNITADQLLQEAEGQNATATTMVVKETAAEPVYLEAIGGLLQHVLPPLSRHLLVLLRNPFHCFLSEVEGRRTWWGEGDLQINQQTFDLWASRTLNTTAQMIELCQAHPSAIVFYETCVLQPEETFTRMMAFLGLKAQPEQQFISRNAADLTKIRGDRSMVENARDVTAISLEKRSRELDNLHAFLAASSFYLKVKALGNVIDAYRSRGVLQVDGSQDYQHFSNTLLAAIRSKQASSGTVTL